ncbi:MAG: hypothetical protein K6E42_04910, partial [Synergistes sp.]|nr:hypothetical protein [Synergistes sp.]
MNENNDNLQETTPSIDKIKEANKVVSDTVNEAENTSEKTTLLGELSEPLCKSMDDVWNSHLVSITSSLKLTDSLFATITKQNEIRSAFADPLREMQVDKIIKSIQLISTAIQPYYQGIVSALSDSIKTFSDSYKPLVDNAIKSLVSSQFDFAQKMQQPIQQMLAAIDFSPLYSIFEQLRGFDFSKYRKKLNHIVIAEMYDAKWFPHALCVDDRKIISQFWSILDSTRKSKNRIIHIDKLVYNRYDKTRI